MIMFPQSIAEKVVTAYTAKYRSVERRSVVTIITNTSISVLPITVINA